MNSRKKKQCKDAQCHQPSGKDANQNLMTQLHIHQDDHDQKDRKCGREAVEKSELSHLAGGNVKWCSHCGKQYGGPPRS